MSEFNKEKSELVSEQLFKTLLENELTEAEAVYALVMCLTIRVAFGCKTIDILEGKLEKAKEYFTQYARSNLSNAMSAILSKSQDIQKGAH